MKGARITHLDTLTANTPKGRRRIRKLLDLQPHQQVKHLDAIPARAIAKAQEQKHSKAA